MQLLVMLPTTAPPPPPMVFSGATFVIRFSGNLNFNAK